LWERKARGIGHVSREKKGEGSGAEVGGRGLKGENLKGDSTGENTGCMSLGRPHRGLQGDIGGGEGVRLGERLQRRKGLRGGGNPKRQGPSAGSLERRKGGKYRGGGPRRGRMVCRGELLRGKGNKRRGVMEGKSVS